MSPAFLVAKLVLTLSLGQGIPVYDKTQILKQIQQYVTQLKQYENMLQNTARPGIYVWGNTRNISNLIFMSQISGLSNFTDYEGYRKMLSCCDSSTGCSDADWKNVYDHVAKSRRTLSEANTTIMKLVDAHQSDLGGSVTDSQKLQSVSTAADGSVKALSNLAGFSSMNLNSINSARNQSALMQRHNVLLAAAQIDREALRTVINECFMKANLVSSARARKRYYPNR